MTLDTALPLIGAVLCLPLLVLFVAKRIYRELPVFFIYQMYGLFEVIAGSIAPLYGEMIRRYVWVYEYPIDLIFYLCVLIELGNHILHYNRIANSRRASAIFLFLLIALLLWSLTPWTGVTSYGWMHVEMRVLQISAILQMAGLVTIVLWSSLRKFAWPERELHIITGMSLWTVVEFADYVLHSHGFFGWGWHWLDRLVSISTTVATAYWLHYFWLEPAAPEPRVPIAAASGDVGKTADPITFTRLSTRLSKAQRFR